ncbi:MAG TPA: class I SAM-dependent methyltransferase [Bacteroidia bacterium]|nr:class I SAM-dependent methyltransferase [Bacteroidia bacterium]
MRTVLFLIRKSKVLFMRWRLHVLVEPFSGFLLNLVYLSKMSKWRRKTPSPAFNDFYSGKWDYKKRFRLYEYLLESEKLDGAVRYMEFGVAAGQSFKWWVEHNAHAESTFDGFDTFTGLPEDWNVFKAGAMSTGGILPDVSDQRATFHKGLFQQTLPGYLQSINDERRKVIHLDADLYTSTLYVLTSVAPWLKKGDILLFDEFAVPRHEFLAYSEFIQSYYIKTELIAAQNNYYFTAFRIM